MVGNEPQTEADGDQGEELVRGVEEGEAAADRGRAQAPALTAPGRALGVGPGLQQEVLGREPQVGDVDEHVARVQHRVAAGELFGHEEGGHAGDGDRERDDAQSDLPVGPVPVQIELEEEGEDRGGRRQGEGVAEEPGDVGDHRFDRAFHGGRVGGEGEGERGQQRRHRPGARGAVAAPSSYPVRGEAQQHDGRAREQDIDHFRWRFFLCGSANSASQLSAPLAGRLGGPSRPRYMSWRITLAITSASRSSSLV